MKAMALILAGVVLPLSSRAADLKALDSKVMLSGCKQDFRWDGSLRDIYITPASMDDWEASFPFLRTHPDVELLCDSMAVCVPEALGDSFFSDPRPMLRLRVGAVLVVFHCPPRIVYL